MKKLNKLLAIILAIAMIMSLAVVVEASSYNIVITTLTDAETDGDETYYAYKIFDATPDFSDPPTYTYTISSDNYLFSTICSLSEVYEEDGTTKISILSTSGTAYFKLTRIGDGTSTPTTYIVVANDAATENDYLASAVVNALKAKVDEDTNRYYDSGESTYNSSDGKFYISVDDPGYYFVTTTVGSAVVVGTTSEGYAELTDKNLTPSVEKTVYDTEDATYDSDSDSNNAQIGDTVYFRTKISNIDDATTLELHDLMEAGLSLVDGSITVTLYTGSPLTGNVLSSTDDYSVDTTTNNFYLIDQTDTTKYPFSKDGTYYTESNGVYTAIDSSSALTEFDSNEDYYIKSSFDITFDLSSSAYDDVDSNSYIIVSYSATLTGEGVEIYTESNDNETYVSYGASSYSTKDLTQTYTYKVTVFKYYEDTTEQPLEGAGFKIYYTVGSTKYYLTSDDTESPYTVTGATDDASLATVFMSGSDGNIVINGLDSDTTYNLTETVTPPDYNPLSSDIEFKVSSEDGTVTYGGESGKTSVKVLNSEGVNMPTTGGIGTTIFYVVGGILVVGAIVLLITKKRLGSEEDK